MAQTADIRNILEKALLPAGFAELPSPGTQTTKWWKHIDLPSDSQRSGALVITIVPGRRLGQFTIIPVLRLDSRPLAPEVTPTVFQGTIHDWLLHQCAMYGTLLEIEDFYHREAP